MDRLIKLLTVIVCFILFFQVTALADTGKIGKEYTIDGECSFTVKSANAYDVFLSQSSGQSKEWIVVTVDLLNWRNDLFYVKTEAKANLVYDDDFKFEVNYLFPDPVGSYRFNKDGVSFLYVTYVDDYGRISKYTKKGNGSSWSFDLYDDTSTYQDIYVNFGKSWGVSAVYHYDPLKDAYVWDDKAFESTDSSKTILDPLVQRTYHYLFLVPDIVAEEEGARELVFTVCGEEFSFRF